MSVPIIGVTTSYEDPAHQELQICNRLYPEAVRLGGGEPKLLNFLDPLEKIPEIVAELDGVLIIGGWDVEPCLYGRERLPECGGASMTKDRYEIALIQETIARKKPLLGICRGIQVINVAMGGTLVQDLPSAIGRVHQQTSKSYWHDIDIVPDTMLHSMMGVEQMMINSYHHQAVDDLAPGLEVCARAADGTIEAAAGIGEGWLFATQWHPERTVAKDRYSPRIFKAFVSACKG